MTAVTEATVLRRMAWRLGFLPEYDELGRSCLEDTYQSATHWVPAGTADDDVDDILFDVAMGLFAWCRYLDLGHPLPAGTEDWYLQNTRRYLCKESGS